jgi:hypothetical protein
MVDPFERLGLPADASAEEVHSARRRLAKVHHPDTGGDATQMRAVNAAAGEALRRIAAGQSATRQSVSGGPDGDVADRDVSDPVGADRGVADRGDVDGSGPRDRHNDAGEQRGSDFTTTAADSSMGWSRVATDVPSFVIDALPAEAFEALVVVASWMGEVLDDDPPYRLDTYLRDPVACFCRLDLVPDAGSSTVSLAVSFPADQARLDLDDIRNAWVANLNRLDWT